MKEQTFKTALLITGDSKGAVKSVKLTEDQLKSLERTQLKGKTSTDRYSKSQRGAASSTRKSSVALNELEKTQKRGIGVAGAYATSIKSVVKNMLVYSAVASALAAIVLFPLNSINQARAFETGLIGVSKTTNIVGEDLKHLADEIDNLSLRIPVSTTKLLSLAQSAGQLGVSGTDNILKFSEVVAKLGRTTDLSGEEAAKSLARILNVTGEQVGSVDVLASVIVSLGNSVAASESEIAHITTQVALATTVFKIGSAQATALGATFAAMGVRAELGGSSVGRVFLEMANVISAGGDDLETFTSTLNISKEALVEAFETDKIAAFNLFLEGVASKGLDAGSALKDVGLAQSGLLKTIIPLAKNLDKYVINQKLANEEAIKATALDKEFEASLKSLDSQWVIFKSNVTLTSRSLAQEFTPAITEALKAFNENDGLKETLSIMKDIAIGVAIGGALFLGMAAWSASIAVTNAALLALGGVIFGVTTISIPALILGIKAIGLASVGVMPAIAAITSAFVIGDLVADYLKDVEVWQRGVVRATQVVALAWTNAKFSMAVALAFATKSGKAYKTQIDLLDRQRLRDIKTINKVAAVQLGMVNLNQILVSGTKELIVDTKDLTDANDDLGKSVVELTDDQQKLIDRLFPLKAAVKKYKDELSQVRKIYKEGTPEQLEAIRRLKLGYAELFPEVARMEDLSKSFEVAWTRSIERMDDAFFDFFRSGLDGWSDFKDGAVDIVKDMVAQILFNFAKIKVLNLAVNAGIGGSVLGATASAAGLTAAGSAGAGALGAGGAGAAGFGFGAVNNFLGATDAGLNFGFTPTNTVIDPASGQLVQTGGFDPIQFLQTAGAGIAGGFIGTSVGSSLFDKDANSAIGSSAGAIIGGAVGGPLGAFIGGTIGGFVDALFGSGKAKDPRFTIGTTNEAPQEFFGRKDIVKSTTSSFGGVKFGSDKDLAAGFSQQDADQFFQFFDAIAQVENSIANSLNTEEVQGIAAAVSTQQDLFKKNSLDFQSFFAERFNTIFDTIGGDMDAAFDSLTVGLSNDELLASIDSIVATTQLIANGKDDLTAYLAGFEAFQDAQSVYIEGQAEVNAIFSSLNLSVPKSVSDFEDLLFSLDLMNEQERIAFQVLTRLVPEVSGYLQELDSVIGEIRNNVTGLIDNVFGSTSLDSLIDIEQDRLAALNKDAQTLFDLESRRYNEAIRASLQLTNAAGSLLLGADSPLTPQERFNFAQSKFSALSLGAEAGDAGAASELASFASVYIQEARSFFASSASFETIFDEVQSVLNGLSGSITGTEPVAASFANSSSLLTDLLSLRDQEITNALAAQVEADRAELLGTLINLAKTSDITLNEVLSSVGLTLSDLASLVDTNGDGLSIDEIAASLIDEETKALLVSLDANQDGFLSNLESLDLNMDGILSALELANANTSSLTSLFNELDTNDNGILEAIEATGSITQNAIAAFFGNGLDINDGALVLALNDLRSTVANTDFSVNIVQPPIQLTLIDPTNSLIYDSPTQDYIPPNSVDVVNTTPGTVGSPGTGLGQGDFDNFDPGDIHMFANGGFVPSAMLGILGEAGPELVLPLDPFTERMAKLETAMRDLKAAQDESNRLQQEAIDNALAIGEQAAGARESLEDVVSDGNTQARSERASTADTV